MRVIFNYEDSVLGANLLHFSLQSRRDFTGHFVGNDCDALGRLEPKTGADSIARSGSELFVDGINS